ncbi:2-oxo-4-hydroxy-4-carboxy-5-ureidoimidazoline decarboxylase [Streptomyces mashuensis]|uniref:2-oxo-4-hydroxy-4-carboxy-5-ureidoimidazoline decarboxylase n=1 Tax=Streptomyces mashuensis TaxID=33904 RepID=A0A919AVP0_9ACTN|nr:2-oxo-4-hydroxy-4-carboxy-5-ureidoimidazoline decarboxylase [Streptomyces mashuensis]GHF25941.1 2-oxo-4-hydroxy-4-carboxy-5-ureidoimidazoline decarboxylase [Streptomyces mashuensis]
MTASPPPGLTRFNSAAEHTARAALHRICSSTAWAERLLSGRPYADADALLAASDAAVADLGPAGLAEALAAHPPIGRPRPGDPVSAREQRGMADAPPDMRAEMLELNLAYQEKYGHVFLICATGLTAEQMRDALRRRLRADPARERETVRTELGRINRLRLARLAVEEGDDPV